MPSALRRVALLLTLLALVAAACSTTIDVTVAPETNTEVDPPADVDAVVSGDGTGVALAGRFTWTDSVCEFDEPAEVSTRCGWLEVPERWDLTDDADTIRLHVGIFSAGPSDAAPVVYLEGGPGGDALENIASSFDVLFGQLVVKHDVIILGQRGTGSAEPELRCDNVLDLSRDLLDDTSGVEGQLVQYQDAYNDCALGFTALGIDTSAYNSVQNAHDVEALRMALGYEQWNVLGISYGTRLGQTLMRLYPDGLRAVILDSVVPTERDPSVDIPATGERAFEALWDGCAASPSCNENYANLEERFFSLVEALDEAPLEFVAQDVLSGQTFPAIVDGTVLMDETFGALYSVESFAAVPELVGQLEAGDTSGIATLVSQSVTSEPFFADGMFWSVECNEEVPFITDESTESGAAIDSRYDRLTPPENADFLASICGSFESGVAPDVEDEAVNSDLPTLLMGGSYDPITPPLDTASLLETMPNAFFFEYPNIGHAAMTDPCAQDMALAFLADPSVAPADACIADIEEPEWVSQLLVDVTFEPFDYDLGYASASGVTPVGWEDIGDGTYVQADNALHTSVVAQQVFSGVPADFMVSSIAEFLDIEFSEVEALRVGDRDWTRYEGVIPGSILDLVVAEEGDSTLLVLLEHAPSDRDRALEVLLPPILEAINP